MRNEILYPPNSQSLSDNIIGSVVQRRWPRCRSVVAKVGTTDLDRFVGRRGINFDSNKIQDMGSNKRHWAQCLSMNGFGGLAGKITEDELRALVKAKRENRRKIQMRYQNKKRKEVAALERSVPQLREEVKQLCLKRGGLLRRKATLWCFGSEYFRLFQHGLPCLERPRTTALNFLRAVVAPDVDTEIASGVGTLIANWSFLTQLFPDIRVQLKTLTQVSTDSLVATTATAITITEQSLQVAFPNLRDDNRSGCIVAKLLGQRIIMCGSVRFDWDEINKRVTGLHTQTDMLSPMLQLLGNLDDVSIVFEDALITPDCNCVVGKTAPA